MARVADATARRLRAFTHAEISAAPAASVRPASTAITVLLRAASIIRRHRTVARAPSSTVTAGGLPSRTPRRKDSNCSR